MLFRKVSNWQIWLQCAARKLIIGDGTNSDVSNSIYSSVDKSARLIGLNVATQLIKVATGAEVLFLVLSSFLIDASYKKTPKKTLTGA